MTDVTPITSTGNAIIDALLLKYDDLGVLNGSKWAPGNLTYSLPALGSCYGVSYGEGENISSFEALNGTQMEAVHAILREYASVCNLTFTEMTETGTEHATLRFAMSDLPNTAWGYTPNTSNEAGDVWFNPVDYNDPVKGNYAYVTFMHEIGHALGLQHPHEDLAMSKSFDAMQNTVMSYRSYLGGSPYGGYTNQDWDYAQSLMMYDIAALQALYGANYDTNSDDTTYFWDPTTGVLSINDVAQDAPGANRIFMTVWDGGGNDTYDFSAYANNLKIDLRPGSWTTTSKTQLAELNFSGTKIAPGNIANALLFEGDERSLIENAFGGSKSDIIYGNQTSNVLLGGSGNDKLYGFDGNDLLLGDTGRDTIYGGAGLDLVSYERATSGVAADLLSPSTNRGEAYGDVYSSIEGLVGSTYNDTLRGNNYSNYLEGGSGDDKLYARNGDDVIYGGAGNDILAGGGGKDTLYGEAGADIFVFTSAGSAHGDTISDFVAGEDMIDLRAIDANVKKAGNQAFIFIENAAFHGVRGELRFADGVLSGDINGDGVADFQINVTGHTTLTSSAFYL